MSAVSRSGARRIAAACALALAASAVARESVAQDPPVSKTAAGAVTLQRRPVAGERLVQAFVLDHTLVAQRMSTRIGDREQTSQDELEFGGRTTFRFVDDVREVDGARATVIRRLVEEASVNVDMRVQSPNGTPRATNLAGGSPLTNAGVVHRWIPSRSEYGRFYDGIETSEEFLPHLRTPIDLAVLLPASPVETGAKWTVDPARMAEVFACGGRVPVRFAKGADAMLVRTSALGVAGPLYEVFGGETTGTVSCELVGVQDGVARVALDVDVRATRDQTELNREMLTARERYDGRRVESARLEWSFRGKGELRWNVAAGRAEGLALTGAEDVRLALALDGPEGRTGSDLALAGGLKLSIDVVARPR